MTENECVETLQYLLGYENAVDAGEIDEHNCLNSQEKEALKFILEEIQQYRTIGTIEEFKALKEHMKIIQEAYENTDGYKDGYAKAIDEFAERLKYEYGSDEIHETIDEIAEEMRGAE